MAEKILNTRIALKIDTLENWKSSTLPLKKGEIAFATVAANEGIGLSEPVVMVKVCGEEGKTFNELPWSFHAKSSDVLSACKDEQNLKAFIANEISNAGIATDAAMKALAGRVETLEKAGYQDADQVTASINSAITALDLGNTYAAKTHTHTKADITDFAHTHEMTEVNGLSDAIKDAKKAGTDANTALEAYKVTNDARVKAVEDDIAEINGENGILAQAKSYTDGKDSAMNTRVVALETEAPKHALKTEVEAVDAKFANYKTAADQKLIDDAQDAEIANKVDKVEGKDLIATSEITRLASVTNYDDTQVKANIAKKADATAMSTALDGKVDKVEGFSLVSDDEIARLAGVTNYDDTDVLSAIGVNAGAIDALEEYVGTIPEGATATDIVGYIQEKTAGIATEGAMTELSNRVKAIEDDYLVETDKTELSGLITAEKERAEGIEAGLRTDVDAIKGDYLKASDKTELEGKITAEETRAKGVEDGLAARIKAVEDDYLKIEDKTALQEQITANANAITLLTDGADPDKVDGVKDLIDYVDEHGTEVTGMKSDIAANTEAISDEAARADAAEKALSGRIETLEGIDHNAYVAADTALKNELEGKINALPAAGITAEDITAWNTEKGANAAAAAAQKTADDYIEAHENDYTNEQIDAAIDADVKALADGAVATNAAGIKTINDTIATYGDIVTHDVDEFATSAQGTKADSALQEIEVGTGLKISEKADNKQTIDIDEAVTFIFNCGDSNV